jgi:hypothetical protein
MHPGHFFTRYALAALQSRRSIEPRTGMKMPAAGTSRMPVNKIVIPKHLDFAALALEREPVTIRLLFAPAPLAELCRVNGLDATAVMADTDMSCSLIAEWYYPHVTAGGAPDPVVELILAEVADSAESGAGLEH